ncbi:hypothetical protein [Erythrobacter sp. F6033]|uniref:hypothetical protein n=1 Tax=Erythrobacter sp. F6033 TaxID=2926401 RepID=UPI001FF4D415|nr:hypothetical protein [Erythrobacter sp. F6033]MCK0129574.1 hypothetical protein [Erythrobacter sp. F6033]
MMRLSHRHSQVMLVTACVALAACDSSGGTAPGAVSEGEARALEEAAEMLDERGLPEGVVPDPDAAVAAEPVDEDANPSGAEAE